MLTSQSISKSAAQTSLCSARHLPFKNVSSLSLLNCATQKEIGHSDLHKLLGSGTEKETNNLVLMKKVFAEGERSAVTISQMKQLATDGQVTSLKSLKSV